jgi:TPR repeat protein
MLSAGCDAGTARDCTNLALLYEQRGAAGDAVRAIALYDVGCQGGSARGCAYLGRAFERGREAYEQARSGVTPAPPSGAIG